MIPVCFLCTILIAHCLLAFLHTIWKESMSALVIVIINAYPFQVDASEQLLIISSP
jgi:hypothetical protein